MRCLCFLCCLFIVSYFSPAQAQEEYEDLLETDSETSDQSEILERIAKLKEHPLDMNTASVTELQQIPWLSPVQAQKIVAYRNKFGHFQFISELLSVPGVDEPLFDKLSPFVRVNVEPHFPFLSGRIRSRIIHGGSTEEIEGGGFLFKEKVSTRSDVSVSDRVAIGLLTEKDADEKYLNDHVVYFLSVDRWNMFDRIVFGNYRLDFGQGLVLGEYSGAFKGAAFPTSLKKREGGLQASTSTFEANSLSGLACSGSLKGVAFSLFGSKADVDATRNDDGTISSIYESGLHRTETEQRKKNTLKEELYGASLSYGHGNWERVGVTYYYSRYAHAFDPKDVERKHYAFRGETNAVGGISLDFYYRRLNVFGELAKVMGAGSGMLIGTVIDFDRLELDVLVREYTRNFYNLHNYAFADKPDDTQNESGVLLGFVFKPNKRTRMKIYVDRVRNPWRRYYEKMPPTREEFWSQVEHQFSERVLSGLRFRVKTNDVNKRMSDNESKNTPRRQTNVRGQIDWRLSQSGRVRGRIERVWLRYPSLSTKEVGWLLFGDFRLVPLKWINIDNRVIYFETDSYDSRLYEYENDLPGLMTNLGLYGEGVRYYALIQVRLWSVARISMKYSVTHFTRIKKNDDHRIGVQFEYNPVL